jgi:hypothetical protein
LKHETSWTKLRVTSRSTAGVYLHGRAGHLGKWEGAELVPVEAEVARGAHRAPLSESPYSLVAMECTWLDEIVFHLRGSASHVATSYQRVLLGGEVDRGAVVALGLQVRHPVGRVGRCAGPTLEVPPVATARDPEAEYHHLGRLRGGKCSGEARGAAPREVAALGIARRAARRAVELGDRGERRLHAVHRAIGADPASVHLDQ